MTQTEFNLLFIQQVHRCEETLRGKAKEYTGNNPDRLSAFKTAAALQECTPERALAGMMAKHIISLYDMSACAKLVSVTMLPVMQLHKVYVMY